MIITTSTVSGTSTEQNSKRILTSAHQCVGNGTAEEITCEHLPQLIGISRSISRDITQTDRDEAVRRLSVYKAWFADKIMEVGRKRTITVLPIENISPRYRDEAISRFNPVGVPMLFLSPILGGPECTVPVGQVTYKSRVSNRQELLPVGLSLLSAPGTDIELLDMIVSCLEHNGRPTAVSTGKTMFGH